MSLDARQQGRPLMFTRFSHQAQSIPDLAARLTDRALEFLRSFRARGDSVELELELWHALTAELKRETRDQGLAPTGGAAPLDGALKRVVNRATLRVAAE